MSRAFEGRRVRVAHVCNIDLSLRYLLGNQMQYLQGLGYDVIGMSAPGPHVAWLADRGIRHVPVPLRRGWSPREDATAVLDIARAMRRERLTIVHTHNAKAGLLGQLAARLAGVPIVVNTIHGFYFHDETPLLTRRFYVLLEQVAAACSTAVLSQSREDMETALAEHIVAPGRIEHLGNGIELSRFTLDAAARADSRRQTRRELGVADDAPVVGFVGRMVEEKGIRELWQAMGALRERVPGVRLLVVGERDSHKEDALSPDDARSYGVEDLCVFTGWRDDLPALYAAMDVLCLPSHREGFPRTPMEASAMGVPVIATNIRGCREAVLDGESGLLVPVRDAAALAEAIVQLTTDRSLRTRLARGARVLAEKSFDERRVFATVAETYARLLA